MCRGGGALSMGTAVAHNVVQCRVCEHWYANPCGNVRRPGCLNQRPQSSPPPSAKKKIARVRPELTPKKIKRVTLPLVNKRGEKI